MRVEDSCLGEGVKQSRADFSPCGCQSNEIAPVDRCFQSEREYLYQDFGERMAEGVTRHRKCDFKFKIMYLCFQGSQILKYIFLGINNNKYL